MFRISIVIFFFLVTTAHAEPQGELVDDPVHLQDYLLVANQSEVFRRSISVDFELERMENVQDLLFVVPLAGEINGRDFYFGVVYNSSYDIRKTEGYSYPLGTNVCLFRIWDLENTAYLRTSLYHQIDVGDAKTSGEGDFLSARSTAPERTGKFTASISIREITSIDGVVGAWLAGFITSHSTNETVLVGEIFSPGIEQRLSPYLRPFIETYDLEKFARERKSFSIKFSNYRLDDMPLKFKGVSVYRRPTVPYVFDSTSDGKSLNIQHHFRSQETERERTLWGKVPITRTVPQVVEVESRDGELSIDGTLLFQSGEEFGEVYARNSPGDEWKNVYRIDRDSTMIPYEIRGDRSVFLAINRVQNGVPEVYSSQDLEPLVEIRLSR